MDGSAMHATPATAESDRELLHRYARTRDEIAFTEIVRRYAGLVHCAARRRLRYRLDADDVTQSVFLLLARHAGKLAEGNEIVAGWLYRTTAYATANVLRSSRRRNFHETRAARMTPQQSSSDAAVDREDVRPWVDAGMDRLGPYERDAVLLRYFQGLTIEEMTNALAVNPNTVAKRVSRGLRKLRTFLQSKGVTVSTAGLGTMLATCAAEAAPFAVKSTAIASGVGPASQAATAIANATATAVNFAKLKFSVVMALLCLIPVVAAVTVAAIGPATDESTTRPTTQPAATTRPADPPDGPRFEAVMPGEEAMVEWIGISRGMGRDAVWWRPDGTPMPRQEEDDADRIEGPVYRVRVRWVGLSEQVGYWAIQGVGRAAYHRRYGPVKGDNGWHEIVFDEPGTPSVNLVQRVAIGDRQKIVFDRTGKPLNEPQGAAREFIPTSVEDQNHADGRRTVVQFKTSLIGRMDVVSSAFKNDGTQVTRRAWAFDRQGKGDQFIFMVPSEEIDRIEIEARPYQYEIRYENVPLDPNVDTSPRLEVVELR